MAKTTDLGFSDTPIEGVASMNFARGLLNFKEDWAVKSITPGKEVVLTNLGSPLDRPEKIRISFSEVANVYSGAGIEDSVMGSSKRGISILVQLTQIASTTDSVDADFRVDSPLSVHMVIKVPSNGEITSGHITTAIGRLLSALYNTGDITATRIEGILRGSLLPSDL